MRTADTEERILAAALELLERRGMAGLTVEEVAEHSGVAKTTIYRRYRNRADLATAALEAHGRLLEEGPLPDDPREAMVEHLRRFRQRMANKRLSVLGAMLAQGADEDGLMELHRERVIRPRTARARAILARAVDRGQIRPDADLDLALDMLVGSYFAQRIAGEEEREDWPERAVALLWDGLGAA
jgi:AcrR family transcriptional regulator